MKLVKDVIQEGIIAFQHGASLDDCLQEPDPEIIVEGTHGSRPIGKVRVGIDWRQIWEIGWRLGELLAKQKKETV